MEHKFNMRTTYLRCLVAAWSLGAVVGCRTKPAAPTTPLPEADRETMVMFIKHQSCEPTTCGDFSCVNVSDGQTKNLPSHLVRCRWTDSRTTNSGRCAYVHYSVDAAGNGFKNMFLSTPAFSDTCEPDKTFIDLIRGQGYSGPIQ